MAIDAWLVALRVPEAVGDVIVDHAGGLHEGIADR
jgi:hypothetical protein